VNGNAQNNQKNFHQKGFLRSFLQKARLAGEAKMGGA